MNIQQLEFKRKQIEKLKADLLLAERLVSTPEAREEWNRAMESARDLGNKVALALIEHHKSQVECLAKRMIVKKDEE
jgi:hypothetical protein